jgi:hypothetical protein
MHVEILFVLVKITLRVEITLVSVILTLIRVKLTLVCVKKKEFSNIQSDSIILRRFSFKSLTFDNIYNVSLHKSHNL